MKQPHALVSLSFLLLATCFSGYARGQRNRAVSDSRPIDNNTVAFGEVTAPEAVSTPVAYPPAGFGAASIALKLTIDEDGSVVSAGLLSGEEPFADAALSAAPSWRFEPARVDGKPRAAVITFRVIFEPPVSEPMPALEQAAKTQLSVELPPGGPTGAHQEPQEVAEVTVAGGPLEDKRGLTAEEVRTLPGAFGDPFRAIDVLPSVLPTATGIPYFYLRGAPVGNTAFVFDGVQVPALFHVLAGPAVIHPSLIGAVDVYSGIYPARMGGMTGGFVVGTSAEPRDGRHAEISLRALDAGALVATPFASGRGNLVMSGRYAYTGWLLSRLLESTKLGYWDYQAKATFDVDHDDRIEVLFLGSNDFLAQRPAAPIATDEQQPLIAQQPHKTVLDLTFHRVDLRWIRQLNNGTLTTAVTGGTDAVAVSDGAVRNSNRELGMRSLAAFRTSADTSWQLGANVTLKRINQSIDRAYFAPPEVDLMCGQVVDSADPVGDTPSCINAAPRYPVLGDDNYELGVGNRFDWQAGAFSEVTRVISPRARLTAGLRGELFSSSGDIALAVDPRLRGRFQITSKVALLHGFGIVHQRPSFPLIVPGGAPTLKGGLQRAVQSDAGIEWSATGTTQATLVAFQHLFFKFTDARGLPIADQELVRATGRSFGVEALVRKRFSDRWGGLMSYTLSRSERMREQFSGAAAGDRTHVVNTAVSYQPSPMWLLGARAVLYSGVPASSRNASAARPRTDPFWRLDVRVEKAWQWSEQTTLRLVLEVLNATLNQEMVSLNCNDPTIDGNDTCREEFLGPITVPNLGLVATF